MQVQYFQTPAIPFKGETSTDPLTFRYYDANRVVLGKKMEDWMRFSVCYWHTFRGIGIDPFGGQTLFRPWDTTDAASSFDALLTTCTARVDAAFEFFTKLGVKYYAFHDRDVAPELASIDESNRLLDAVTDYMLIKQKETGVKLLWGYDPHPPPTLTANLFSAAKYACGGATNPDLKVFAQASAQVKKAMEVTHKLGGEGYVFWGGREGYQTILNTDIKKELDHMAAFFHMAVDWKKSLGANFQFYIEPKPKEPTKHQYDYDAQTVMCFLKQYNLDDHFLLNIEPNHTTLAGHAYEHDIVLAAAYGKLGSVDCNTGDELLGWDTDQFLMDERKATLVMKAVVDMGGFTTGGLNFDCKVRRESTDLEDIFIAHVGSMDVFAKGLLNAAKLIEDGRFDAMKSERYSSWVVSELGQKVEAGNATFAELEAYAKLNAPTQISGKQELYERVFNDAL
ncbi:hypothetical protein HK100_002165 [Physocladia obscura]|uniref:Xylose isomerase n=1 Tax=Physocladia obscura TaxID=109957 RepID=A0AAD5SVN0_9FUNG|nr:hypothetical protein HK100_002165 [Physocladia obscura]